MAKSSTPPPPSGLPHAFARQVIAIAPPGAPPQLAAEALDAMAEWEQALDAGLIGARAAAPPDPAADPAAAAATDVATRRAAMEAAFRSAGLCRPRGSPR